MPVCRAAGPELTASLSYAGYRELLQEQFAKGLAQVGSWARSSVGEFQVTASRDIIFRPERQVRAIGIAGLGEVRPILLHLLGEFGVGIGCLLDPSITKHVLQFAGVGRARIHVADGELVFKRR